MGMLVFSFRWVVTGDCAQPCSAGLSLLPILSHTCSHLRLPMVLLGVKQVNEPRGGRKSPGTFPEKSEPVFAEKLLPGKLKVEGELQDELGLRDKLGLRDELSLDVSWSKSRGFT